MSDSGATMILIIKQGILAFWGLWFTVVLLSDITNFLQVLQILPENFAFTSKNYDLVAKYLNGYNIHSRQVIISIFLLIIAWALIAAFLFWCSLFSKNIDVAYLAFIISISMTAFFILADEFFIQYQIEHNHIMRLMFQCVTLLTFHYFVNK